MLSLMKNSILSIVIPTFNRPEILKQNILEMLSEKIFFSIPIYVSDDSSDDRTKNMIFELQEDYEYLFYHKNITSLGHDKNIISTLKMAESEYVWLLSDSLTIKMGAIKHVLQIVAQYKPEIIGVNNVNRDFNIKSNFYNDKNKVLREFGWHLTLTGSTIYSRSAISTSNKIIQEVQQNFPHIALIFNHLALSCSFYWINDRWTYSHEKKTSYWVKEMFQVFIDDWSNVIKNLPQSYDDDVKEEAIIEHSRKTKLFGLRSLVKARSMDAYNIRIFREYAKDLGEHSGLNIIILMVIAIIPKATFRILQFLKRIYK
jgi:abequosyltransferase